MSKGTGAESDDLKAKAATERKANGALCQPEVHHDIHTLGGFELEKTKKACNWVVSKNLHKQS